MDIDSYRIEMDEKIDRRLSIFNGRCDWCSDKVDRWEQDHILPQEAHRKFPFLGNADAEINRWALCIYCHRERKDEVDAALVQWLLGVRILATDSRYKRTSPEELFWNEYQRWKRRARIAMLPDSRLKPVVDLFEPRITKELVKIHDKRWKTWNEERDQDNHTPAANLVREVMYRQRALFNPYGFDDTAEMFRCILLEPSLENVKSALINVKGLQWILNNEGERRKRLDKA